MPNGASDTFRVFVGEFRHIIAKYHEEEVLAQIYLDEDLTPLATVQLLDLLGDNDSSTIYLDEIHESNYRISFRTHSSLANDEVVVVQPTDKPYRALRKLHWQKLSDFFETKYEDPLPTDFVAVKTRALNRIESELGLGESSTNSNFLELIRRLVRRFFWRG